MRNYLLFTFFIFSIADSNGQSKKENAVSAAVERLRVAMIDGNGDQLEKLVSDKLTYGHSGGHIDDKKEFIEKLTSGRSDFVTMDLTAQTIIIHGNTAIVRHTLSAQTNDSGKPGEVHLLVMLVWQKQHGRWILLARQAVKPS
jgi:hypothetical protein